MWFVYIVQCSDNTLYTGISNNLERRLKQHNSGKGAKYTRGRTPVTLLKFFECETKSV
jgi:putative endonuclease